MSKKSKAKAAEEAAAAEAEVEKAEEKKKRGFFGRMLRSSMLMGAVAAGVKYFGDPNEGGNRREKVKGQVKTLAEKQKAAMENKTKAPQA